MAKGRLDPSISLARICLHRIIGADFLLQMHMFLQCSSLPWTRISRHEAIDEVAGGVELLLDNEAARPAYVRVLYFYGVPSWMKMCRRWRMRRKVGVRESSGESSAISRDLNISTLTLVSER